MTAVPDAQFWLVAAPLLGVAVNVFAQIVLVHWGVVGTHLGPIIAAFGGGLAVTLAITVVSATEPGATWLAATVAFNAFAYVGWAYCYFTAVNLLFTSLRIRIVRELLRTPQGMASLEHLAGLYDARDVLERRLDRLQAWGQIVPEGQGFRLAPAPLFLLLDRTVLALRVILTGSSREMK